jgi:hypothetical protein
MSKQQKEDQLQIIQQYNLIGFEPSRDLIEELAQLIQSQAAHLNRVTGELEALKLAQGKSISARLREWWNFK